MAQRQRWAHVEEAHKQFETLAREDDGAAKGRTPEEIEAQAWEVYDLTLKDAEDGAMSEEDCDTTLSTLWSQNEDRLERGQLLEIERAELSARMHAYNNRIAALRGRPFEPPLTFGPRGINPRTGQPTTRRAFTRRTGAGGGTQGDALRFAEAAERYLSERQRDPEAQLTGQTIGQTEAVFRLFRDFSRDAPLDVVTRDMAADFLARVATLDPLWGRKTGVKDKTFTELLDEYGGHPRGMSNRTLNRYSSTLGALWRWSARRGLLSEDAGNPWEGQFRKTAPSRRTGWLPFEIEELSVLLTHFTPEVAPRRHTTATALAWVTWIGAYSGMRLNEICSLTTEDVKQADDVWYFRVENAKTPAGDRNVPVHSVLVQKGLLQYAEKARGGTLWPSFRPGGPDGKLMWYASRRFTAARRALGIERERVSFHSLRKNATRCLELARVPQSEAAQLLGHERKGFTYSVYNPHGLTLEHLQSVVERIRYEGVGCGRRN